MTTTDTHLPAKNLVLITGACGFIGSHLVQHYLAGGFEVIGVDNFSTALRKNLETLKALEGAEGRFHFFEADVCQPWDWFTALPEDLKARLGLILHFASPASPPVYQKLALETMWVNSIGLYNCIQTADKFRARVVFASTSEIYGDPLVHPQPEYYWGNVNPGGPRSCYDEGKRFGESLITTCNLKNGTHHGLVRIFNTYGPRMNPADGRVVINFLTQAMNGDDLSIYGTGSQTRSFCFIDDMVLGITAYAAQTQLSSPINLGNPTELTIIELAEMIIKLFPNVKIATGRIPLPINDPMKRNPDITKAREVLKWEPRVPLEVGLVQMSEWLKKEI